MLRFAVVTASIDPDATRKWWGSWRQQAIRKWDLIMVHNAPGAGSGVSEVAMEGGAFVWVKHDQILGPVPAFYLGIQQAALRRVDVVACLHDDLRIDEQGWDAQVIEFFATHPNAGLAGFGGAKGLGEEGIYEHPYSPMDLVRKDFISNMENAEAHGRRVVETQQVACLDGFSQIGRIVPLSCAFTQLRQLGIVHHAYDSAIGALMREYVYETWLLPVRCHHAGGQTAVANPRYHEWLAGKGSSDQVEWERSHRVLYQALRSVLPIRVE